jgi:hypothetical protein
VAHFKHLGTIRTTQNYIHQEIKGRLSSCNACCHLIQNILSFPLMSKNIQVKIYSNKTMNLPVVLYGCETRSLTFREEHGLRVFLIRVPRRMYGVKRN